VNALAGHVEDYLRLRRALGFKLRFHGRVLPSLAAYLEQAGAATVTAELAVAWAGLPQGVHPVVWSSRLGAARGFARYLKTVDPAAEVPPERVWPSAAPRREPVIFTDADIARLLQAARALRRPLRAATLEAMLGLIAATGMRLGEAIGLERAGADLEAGLLTIFSTKSGRDRLIPLHPTVTAALAGYARRRDELCPAPSTSRFFVSCAGTPVHERLADMAFARLTQDLGLRAGGRQPRIHDYADTFVMPMPGRSACSAVVSGLKVSA
jgi:integrase/recombinase XerD